MKIFAPKLFQTALAIQEYNRKNILNFILRRRVADSRRENKSSARARL